MDKKTKMWLGVGVVGVGAYLLWKSKQPKATTTTTTTTAPAGATASFASVGDNEKFTNFTSEKVGPRMISANGVGDRMKPADGFAGVYERQVSATGGMINSLDVKGARAGSQNSGIFANQPFTGDVANMVGANSDKVFASQDGTGKFFKPRTAKYGQNQGVFASSTEKPLNNLVGQDGSRFFSVHDGFGK
jgi:hypothetical protein